MNTLTKEKQERKEEKEEIKKEGRKRGKRGRGGDRGNKQGGKEYGKKGDIRPKESRTEGLSNERKKRKTITKDGIRSVKKERKRKKLNIIRNQGKNNAVRTVSG